MVYTSTQMVKCWSCSEVPNDLECSAYILWKSTHMIKNCRNNKHYLFPISYHGYVRCMACKINDINPERLGDHLHHPLTGQEDWNHDYGK